MKLLPATSFFLFFILLLLIVSCDTEQNDTQTLEEDQALVALDSVVKEKIRIKELNSALILLHKELRLSRIKENKFLYKKISFKT
ncbi:hypothetical protein [Kordia sp.]|uniref:hypothetical protein n=1 Tax=Kordia sp. TaxID=1965332 RepID=UPI003D298E06